MDVGLLFVDSLEELGRFAEDHLHFFFFGTRKEQL